MKHTIIAALLGLIIVAGPGQARAGEGTLSGVVSGQGTLDKDLIRRIVAAHINEIRYCYNQALASDPEAKGRVVLDFTIGESGSVIHSVVGSSDMADAKAPECMAAAALRWIFPKPDGGVVVVSYPFVLEPG
ncbi:MAG: AgmX/PglI C-terminal domain-containing protein [Nannocystis sp.]|nr:AgmX/PglI C-terminal domain-containing protein [Nannocystis sp.]MBA3550444.1 AgmX/PglI C-terminal domain-containing protein [Nannocystis sp.]